MLSASSRGNGECRKSNVIFLEACGAATSRRAESGGESLAGKSVERGLRQALRFLSCLLLQTLRTVFGTKTFGTPFG